MTRSRLLLFLVLIILIEKGCSTAKQNEYDNDVRAYLTQFEKNLSASDDVIMQQFRLSANGEITNVGVLRVINILQNKNEAEDSLHCTVNFNAATISSDEATIKVEIPTLFTSIDTAFPLEQAGSFTLYLSSGDQGYFISNIEAQPLYYKYQETAYELKSRKHRERDIASRKIFFDQARVLQQTYDSVIWYTNYQDSIYYYVVNGEWKNYFVGEDTVRSRNVKMGLVGESGKVIVPPAYDQVGTIGFEHPNVVEVRRAGKVGQFKLDGTEILPAVYDWIIPYDKAGEYALVKKDTVVGWIDRAYVYHDGYPSDVARKYIEEFQYLNEKVYVKNGSTTMTEILHVDHMGSGLVVPPTYLVKAGVLSEIMPHFFIGENSLGWGGIESVETTGSLFERFTDNFAALMVKITDQYLEGREGFYERTEMTILDNNNRIVSKEVMRSGTISFHKVDSTLLEIRVTGNEEVQTGGYSEADDDIWFAPFYKYYKLGNGTLTKLESNREYSFTQFVKIDSSYLTGTFIDWNDEANDVVASNFAREYTLARIRNEILASYGYSFKDPDISNDFRYREWYVPRYSKYEDFIDQMTEIDRHNLEFLETLIATLNVQEQS